MYKSTSKSKDLNEPEVETAYEDNVLQKYIEPDKVTVILVRNCGLIVDDKDDQEPSSSNSKFSKGKRKKDSMGQPAYKIPLEIRRNAHTSKKGWRKYAGIIFGITSGLFFSLTVLIAKVLRDYHEFHPICITAWRYLGILVPAVPIAGFYRLFTEEEIFDSIWPLNEWKNIKHAFGYVMQGILGCTSIIFRFYSLQFLTVADTSVISFSSPVFVTVLAHFCLKEKCGIVSILVAICTAVGVVVIARPPMLTGSVTYDSNLWIGAMIAVGSMMCASGLIILLRNIRRVHFSLLLLISGGWGVLQSSVLGFSLNIMKLPETTTEVFLIGLLSLLTFFGQMSIILALKYEHAGPVSVVRSCEVLFAFGWQLLFLGVYPDVFSIIGGGIIVFAVVITASKNWIAGLPHENNFRRRLSCLLK